MYDASGKFLGYLQIVPRCGGKVWLIAFVAGRGMLRNLDAVVSLARSNGVELLEMYARTCGMAAWASRHGWRHDADKTLSPESDGVYFSRGV